MSGGVATRFLTLTLDLGEMVSFFHLPLHSALLPLKEPEGASRFPLDRSQRQPPIRSGRTGEKKNCGAARSRVQFLRLGVMFSVCLPSIAWRVLGLLVSFYFLASVFHSFVLPFLLPSLFYSPFCSLILTLLLAVTLECTASNGWVIHGTWIGNIGCPETSVTNYHSALRNMAEERNFHYSFTYLSLCGSIKTQKVGLSETAIKLYIFFKQLMAESRFQTN